VFVADPVNETHVVEPTVNQTSAATNEQSSSIVDMLKSFAQQVCLLILQQYFVHYW